MANANMDEFNEEVRLQKQEIYLEVPDCRELNMKVSK